MTKGTSGKRYRNQEVSRMAENQQGNLQQQASQIQQQIQAGQSPEQAVSNNLGAGAAATAGMTGSPGGNLNRTGEAEDIDNQVYTQMFSNMGEGMERTGDATQEATEQAGGMMSQAAGTAQEWGARVMDAARGYAMEIGEALFGGGEKEEKDKI
jgi:hypothetical protein